MAETLVQLVIVGVWGVMLAMHTRRLLRLAHVEAPTILRTTERRSTLARIWWWLGREEFWRAVQADGLRCTQLTIMVFLIAWGLLS